MELDPDDEKAWIDDWLMSAPPEDEPRRFLVTLRHPLSIASVILGIAIAVAMIGLRPTGVSRFQAEESLNALGTPSEFVAAVVSTIDIRPCGFSSAEDCTTVRFVITEGPETDRTYLQEFSGGTVPVFEVGASVVLAYQAPNGVVESIETVACSYDPDQTCDRLSIRMTYGSSSDRIVTSETGVGFAEARTGEEVTVFFDENGEVVGAVPVDVQTQYRFSDLERSRVLLVTLVIFGVAVIALGGWRGVAALVALGTTLVVVLVWLLPAILDGRNTVLVALVGASAIAYLALYVSHGFNLLSTVALFGTIGALVLTTLLSWVTVQAAHFSGFATEESVLLVLFQEVDIRGLVLAGMVLGAAGALDDVTITQASAVWQMKSVDPDMAKGDLLRRGLRIGQHHIGSTVNTLLLAYLGASLPLAVLLVLSQQSLGSIANSEVIAIEIVRTLVGSIGLVAAVPITTWLAVRVVSTSPALPDH